MKTRQRRNCKGAEGHPSDNLILDNEFLDIVLPVHRLLV